jgi:peptide/nickel transport system substrate-binding protein
MALILSAVLGLALAQDDVTEFVFAHPGPIRTMDAPVTWFGSTHWLTNTLYDCLIWRAADGSGYVPQAAERWESIDDRTWRFHLRADNTFQNGEVLDAAAVKWNLDRVMSREDFLVHPQWQFIEEVVVVDALTLDVITDEPHAYTLNDISFNGCQILPPQYLEEVGEEEFARNPVGSGPYRLVEFSESDRYVFEAWDGYWDGRPEIDRIIYQVIPEQASQIAALLAGQVDFVPNVPLPEIERLQNASGVELLQGAPSRMIHLYLRGETASGAMAETYPGYQPVTLDKRIRQAISHALDRSLLAEVQGSARPMLVRVASTFPEAFADTYAGSENADAWYDPEMARQLIAEAGYDPAAGNAPKLFFDAMAFQLGNEKEVAEVVKIMLEEVGFEVEMNILELSAYREQVSTPGNNRDAMMVALGGSPFLTPLFYTCEWQQSNYNVCVEAWDAVGKQILTTVDEGARLALWEQWQEFFIDEAVTVPLYEITGTLAINSDFAWTPRSDGWFTFRDLSLR